MRRLRAWWSRLVLVVTQAMWLALAGVVLGVVTAIVLSPLVSSQLFGVAAADPATITTVAAAMLSVALLGGGDSSRPRVARRSDRDPSV